MPSSANVDGHALGAEQGLVLLGQARAGLRQDADEILLRQRAELDADRQAALKFRQKVGGLGECGTHRTR